MIAIEQYQIEDVTIQRKSKWMAEAVQSLIDEHGEALESVLREIEVDSTDFYRLAKRMDLILDDHLYRLLRLFSQNEKDCFFTMKGDIRDGLFDYSDLAETKIQKFEKRYGNQ